LPESLWGAGGSVVGMRDDDGAEDGGVYTDGTDDGVNEGRREELGSSACASPR